MVTAAELRNRASESRQKAEESFDRCDTDGFLSQWALGLGAQKDEMQAEIIENGGKSNFPALFNLEGKRVRAKLITTHPSWAPWTTSTCWALCDKSGKFIGKFITAFPARESTMAKKGYKEGTEDAPAKAVIQGSGYGLSGSAWAAVVRTDNGYPENAIDG
jgi:hypothetical protein